MGLEALVFSLCIGNFGCGEALRAYYYERPHIKYLEKKVKNKAIRIAGEETVFIVPALATMIVKKRFQMRINKNFSLGGNTEETLLFYRHDF